MRVFTDCQSSPSWGGRRRFRRSALAAKRDGAYWGDASRRIAVINNAFNVCLDHIFEPNRIVSIRQIDTGSYTDYTLNLVA